MRNIFCRLFHNRHWDLELLRFRNGHQDKVICPKCKNDLGYKRKNKERW